MKNVFMFLVGMFFGMTIVSLMILIILDNDMDKMQPPIEGIIMQIEALSSDIESMRVPIKGFCNNAVTANLVMRDVIEIGRKEMNDYNRLWEEKF